eukprot:GHVU01109915.1.p1 GENE.GHVU01109915.1~~GHVU01109915.1.p1  ORF type:complete len:334 (+),score=48.41 GHVU01109915.1:319-1320(+)
MTARGAFVLLLLLLSKPSDAKMDVSSSSVSFEFSSGLRPPRPLAASLLRPPTRGRWQSGGTGRRVQQEHSPGAEGCSAWIAAQAYLSGHRERLKGQFDNYDEEPRGRGSRYGRQSTNWASDRTSSESLLGDAAPNSSGSSTGAPADSDDTHDDDTRASAWLRTHVIRPFLRQAGTSPQGSSASSASADGLRRLRDLLSGGWKGLSKNSVVPHLSLDDGDVDEKFVKGSGKGGQKINKVRNRVVLVHRPTGIAARCQASRSLHSNRTLAREILAAKLLHYARRHIGALVDTHQRAIRRQRQPTAEQKVGVTAEKKRRSTLKAIRRKVSSEAGDQ